MILKAYRIQPLVLTTGNCLNNTSLISGTGTVTITTVTIKPTTISNSFRYCAAAPHLTNKLSNGPRGGASTRSSSK